MTGIRKSISNKTEYYKFWNDRITETRPKIHRGHLTILGVYGPTEGREELSEEFYETLQKLPDKVNNIDCIILIEDMNTIILNNKLTNIVGYKWRRCIK